MNNKVVVGMSGGVDSSVAAWLLKEEGYDVIGVTMSLLPDEDDEEVSENGGCCGLSGVEDARRVSSAIGIPHYVLNLKKEFKEKVIDDFVSEYNKARTPNPCIACNRFIKWGSLLDKSIALGADHIATGHYAEVIRLPNGRYSVKASANNAKDQSYALYNLTQEQLKRTIMPVAGRSKDEIRSIASNLGLCVADKPDSQDICFVKDDYNEFLKEYTGKEPCPGDFIDTDGNVIGKHKGITHYTIGQRRGLGISAKERLFVKRIDPVNNTVILSSDAELYTDKLNASDVTYMAVDELKGPKRLFVKIRYNHKGEYAEVIPVDKDRVKCIFERPQRAVTPGQSVVFYEDDHIFGGGYIDDLS